MGSFLIRILMDLYVIIYERIAHDEGSSLLDSAYGGVVDGWRGHSPWCFEFQVLNNFSDVNLRQLMAWVLYYVEWLTFTTLRGSRFIWVWFVMTLGFVSFWLQSF